MDFALGSIGISLLVIFCITLYLIPTIIAFKRGHHNAVAIMVVNLLFGWLGIGWVLALVWSVTALRAQPQTIIINNGPVPAQPSVACVAAAMTGRIEPTL
jgi:hypothetical protein